MNTISKNKKFIIAMTCFLSGTILYGATAEPEDGVHFFQRHYLRRGNYKDQPLPGETLDKLRLHAAKGEYEPVQFLMRSAKPVMDVAVTMGNDFRSKGTSISKDNVEIRIVVDQKRWLNPRRFERHPYLLMKKSLFSLKPNETERIWLTVHVPEDAKPGKYTSFVKVSAGEKRLKTIPVELNVRPFKLKKITPDQMCYLMYFWPGQMPDWAQHNIEYLTGLCRDMKEHGMNSITAYVFPSHAPNADVLNSLNKQRPDGPLTFTQFMKILNDSEFIQKGSKYIWSGAYNAPPRVLKTVSKFIEDSGMEIIYYGQDEPETEERQKTQRWITKRLKEICPDKKIATAIGHKGIEAVGDQLDIWICETIDLDDKRKAEADEKGKILYSYECRLAPIDPLTSRHYFGFMVWRAGAEGAMHWVHAWRGKNRFGLARKNMKLYDPDCQYNFSFVFLSPDGPVPSIGWEGVREGVDDYRYIATLKDWIAKAKTAGKNKLAKSAENLLKELHNKINPENYKKAFETALNQKEPGKGGGAGSNFDRPPPEPGLKPGDYDEYRHRIAKEIINIANALSQNALQYKKD